MHGKIFVGHFSSSTDNNRREFIGMEVEEGYADGRDWRASQNQSVQWWFRRMTPSVQISMFLQAAVFYTFTYTYDPNYENDAAIPVPRDDWRCTLLAQASPRRRVCDQRCFTRDAGSTFDAFGMGIRNNGNDAAVTIPPSPPRCSLTTCNTLVIPEP